MQRAVQIIAVLAVAIVAACTLLPERYTVNGPIVQQVFGIGGEPISESELEQRIQVPDGFSISVFAEHLRPRMLRMTRAGNLLVSAPRDGEVLWLAADADGDGRADARRTLLEGLDRPHGIDVHDGWLYVAEGGALGRIRFDPVSGETRGTYERLVEDLPRGGNHWTRTLRVGPDDHLYVSIGSSCNVCEEEDPRRAALVRYRLDGSGEEILATGLRNSVGFDWQPGTGALFATDNGRDLLGDDFPPCELNRLQEGGFYGWPYANGDRVPDPDFGSGHRAEILDSIPPVHAFRAHTAPLGITFVHEPAAPAAYREAALVALHGSWNRTRKDGYKLVSLHWGPDGEVEERDFATGFERDERVIGRPVDVAVGPDGAFYVSDDYAQAIYRIAEHGAAGDPRSGTTQPRGRASETGQEKPADPEDEDARERGLALYENLACYGCHEAERATPGTLVVPLEPALRARGIEAIANFLAAPTPPMPAYDLDARERRDLAVYLAESAR